MRTIVTKTSIPRRWIGARWCRATHEFDIAPSPHSRLRCKVLVFRDVKDLQHCWSRGPLRSGASRGCLGIVNALGYHKVDYQKGGPEEGTNHRHFVDPRYFAVMGLSVTHIGTEITTHEAIHAAFAYAKRIGRKDACQPALDNDEESVCYPAGRMHSQLAKMFWDSGLYDTYERHRAQAKPLLRRHKIKAR
jgi:hypothetical protein